MAPRIRSVQPLPSGQIPADRLPDDLFAWRCRILPASDRPGHRTGFNEATTHHYQLDALQHPSLLYPQRHAEERDVACRPCSPCRVALPQPSRRLVQLCPTEVSCCSTSLGRTEDGEDLSEILAADDRQPGWRTRSFIHKYDLATGVFQRLTYGHTPDFHQRYFRPTARYLLFLVANGS
ncbi:MAG: hypothetical protein ACLR6J_01365 [Parabacteroides merdae]